MVSHDLLVFEGSEQGQPFLQFGIELVDKSFGIGLVQAS